MNVRDQLNEEDVYALLFLCTFKNDSTGLQIVLKLKPLFNTVVAALLAVKTNPKLLAVGADINSKDKQGLTAYECTKSIECKELLELPLPNFFILFFLELNLVNH